MVTSTCIECVELIMSLCCVMCTMRGSLDRVSVDKANGKAGCGDGDVATHLVQYSIGVSGTASTLVNLSALPSSMRTRKTHRQEKTGRTSHPAGPDELVEQVVDATLNVSGEHRLSWRMLSDRHYRDACPKSSRHRLPEQPQGRPVRRGLRVRRGLSPLT